jgi:DNA (cytosine-5)-methyltransferase 1
VVDDSDDEELSDDRYDFLARFADDSEVEDSTDAQQLNTSASTKRLLRNQPVSHPFEEVTSYRVGDLRLEPGKSVEFIADASDTRDFLMINKIRRNLNTGDIILRGLHFRRASRLEGMVEKKLNEVVLVLEDEKDDPRPKKEQCQIDVALEAVVKNRKIILTHRPFPHNSFRQDTILHKDGPDYKAHKETVKATAVLVCRMVFTSTFRNAKDRLAGRKSSEGVLRRIRPAESVHGYGSTAPTVMEPERTSVPIIEFGRKVPILTSASGCAGGGGDATGACQAGWKLKYVWDRDGQALESIRLNHENVIVYRREAVDFPHDGEDDTVMHLHLSWPCQTFSPAKRGPSEHDDANSSAMFGTYEKLISSGALLHTQENTDGLFTRHPAFFCSLIREITRAGYNVRFKVVQFMDYGIAQSRKRLIVIAAK